MEDKTTDPIIKDEYYDAFITDNSRHKIIKDNIGNVCLEDKINNAMTIKYGNRNTIFEDKIDCMVTAKDKIHDAIIKDETIEKIIKDEGDGSRRTMTARSKWKASTRAAGRASSKN